MRDSSLSVCTQLHVELTPDQVSYRLRGGEPPVIFHDNEPVTVLADQPLNLLAPAQR